MSKYRIIIKEIIPNPDHNEAEHVKDVADIFCSHKGDMKVASDLISELAIDLPTRFEDEGGRP